MTSETQLPDLATPSADAGVARIEADRLTNMVELRRTDFM
jgi:hypothetical protein